MKKTNSFTVAGIGPGNRDYLLPITARAARESEILIGGERALKLFSHLETEKYEITADLEKVRTIIENNYTDRKVVVLVSGDPGLYSLAGYLRRFFGRDEMVIIPGVSAMQLAFARAKLLWQDARFLSLHGRENLSRLHKLVLSEPKVGVFTDKNYTPARIAEYLLQQGCPDKEVFIAENLTYEQETNINCKLSQLAGQNFSALNVMVIYDEK